MLILKDSIQNLRLLELNQLMQHIKTTSSSNNQMVLQSFDTYSFQSPALLAANFDEAGLTIVHSFTQSRLSKTEMVLVRAVLDLSGMIPRVLELVPFDISDSHSKSLAKYDYGTVGLKQPKTMPGKFLVAVPHRCLPESTFCIQLICCSWDKFSQNWTTTVQEYFHLDPLQHSLPEVQVQNTIDSLECIWVEEKSRIFSVSIFGGHPRCFWVSCFYREKFLPIGGTNCKHPGLYVLKQNQIVQVVKNFDGKNPEGGILLSTLLPNKQHGLNTYRFGTLRIKY